MTSWLSSDAAPAALLDELVKIGEDANEKANRKDRLIRAMKAVGISAAGGAAGIGGAMALEGIPSPISRFLKAQKPVSQAALWGIRLGLPILGGLALTLGARHKKKLDEEMSGVTPNDVRRT
jgi:hypothetical protein